METVIGDFLAEDMAAAVLPAPQGIEKWMAAWHRGRPSHGSFYASALSGLCLRSRRDRIAGLSPYSPWVLAYVLDNKKDELNARLFWRRTWDSNPRGCYTLLAFQASSLATRSILQMSVDLLSLRATCINLTQTEG